MGDVDRPVRTPRIDDAGAAGDDRGRILVGALGMQLMAFEDMTYELRRTNRRLETAQAELRELVITDPLTGTRNRRFFDEIIGRELQRHRRYGRRRCRSSSSTSTASRRSTTRSATRPATSVLRDVAAFLLRNIREADYVFRWGGDEFLVLISCGEAGSACAAPASCRRVRRVAAARRSAARRRAQRRLRGGARRHRATCSA